MPPGRSSRPACRMAKRATREAKRWGGQRPGRGEGLRGRSQEKGETGAKVRMEREKEGREEEERKRQGVEQSQPGGWGNVRQTDSFCVFPHPPSSVPSPSQGMALPARMSGCIVGPGIANCAVRLTSARRRDVITDVALDWSEHTDSGVGVAAMRSMLGRAPAG
eukprot:1624932-Rhodomonas_salina.1